MAGKLDIEITKGDSYSNEITFETCTNNVVAPINITGRTYSAKIRRVATQTTPDATFTCTVINGVAGQLTIYLTDTQTNSLSPADYRWDLQENASGIISTILAGRCRILADVTW